MPNKKQFFMTGTDTGVGKTLASCGVLNAANKLNRRTCGLKPIASGCEMIDGLWRNEDALALQQAANVSLPYTDINPFAFPEAIAPHIAAEINTTDLSVSAVVQHCQTMMTKSVDFTVIEGAGGWLVPLNKNQTFADIAAAMQLPIILVVGIRLGCINHALLTARCIQAMGLTLAAWVANELDPETDNKNEIFESLNTRLPAPCLGRIPFLSNSSTVEDISEHLDVRLLLD